MNDKLSWLVVALYVTVYFSLAIALSVVLATLLQRSQRPVGRSGGYSNPDGGRR